MFELTKKLVEPIFKFGPKFHKDIPRLAIAEDGTVAYASPSFCTLSHMKPDEAGVRPVGTVLKFVEHDSEQGLGSGVHPIKINGHEQVFHFHFDWLVTPDQRRFLVGSEADKGEAAPPEDLLQKLGTPPEPSETQDNQAPEERVLGAGDVEKLLELSQDLMAVVDDQGIVLNVNTPFLKTLGYSVDEVSQIRFADIFAPEDQAFVRNQIEAAPAKTKQDAPDFEARITTKSGEQLAIIWRYAKGDDITYCLGRDVTDQKIQEEAYIRRELQLNEAESIGRMGHWNWMIGQEDIDWSAQIYEIFGVDQETFKPTLHGMNDMVSRRDLDRVNQGFQRAMIEKNNYDMEFCINRPDGEVRFIRCEGRCSLDENDEVVALYGIMQDMTERISYERDLKHAKEAAERAYAAKSQFLANMSHELRTPLNAIIGFSDMMKTEIFGPLGDDKYKEYVVGIQESGEHLLDLISDILDMSKIEAGKYELDLEEVSLSKIIKMATHMMESKAREEGVELSTPENLDENLKIVADRRAVMQVVLNLMSNAVKFTEDGGKVTLSCVPGDKFVTLKVTDDGIGIPANKLAQITQPFEQAQSDYTRTYQGSGLGLAITKELVDMHGGQLSIESEVGVGTAVTIKFPYRPPFLDT